MPTQGKETSLVQSILRRFSKGNVRLFRRNAGMGWAGKAERYNEPRTVVVRPEDVVVRNARPLHAGDEGMPDLEGFVMAVITPDMVGQRVAIACYLEAKATRGITRATQAAFMVMAKSHGCLTGVVRSEEDAAKVLTPFSDGCQGSLDRQEN